MPTLLSVEPWLVVTAGYSAQNDNYGLTVYGPRHKDRIPGERVRWMLELQVGYSGIDSGFVFAPALFWHARKAPKGWMTRYNLPYRRTRRLL